MCTGLKPLVYSPEMIPGGLKRTHADTSQKECGSDPSICSHGLRLYSNYMYSKTVQFIRLHIAAAKGTNRCVQFNSNVNLCCFCTLNWQLARDNFRSGFLSTQFQFNIFFNSALTLSLIVGYKEM